MCPDHNVWTPSICLFLMGLSPFPNSLYSLLELPESPPSSACPLPDQSRPAPKKVSCFDQCKYTVCFSGSSACCREELWQHAVSSPLLGLPRVLTIPRLDPSTWGAGYMDKGDWRFPNCRLSQTREHAGLRQPLGIHAGTTTYSQLPFPNPCRYWSLSCLKWSWSQIACVWLLAPPFSSCVSLDKSHDLLESHFPHL